jgi:hypothetical protein
MKRADRMIHLTANKPAATEGRRNAKSTMIVVVVGLMFGIAGQATAKPNRNPSPAPGIRAFSGDQHKAELPPEAADPDTYDLSVWNNVKPGIQSGFGSPDVSYSKSIPPKGKIENSITLRGWKGERVSCLLLVWSALNKENITIQTSGFSDGHFKIGPERISISALRYVLVGEFHGCGANDKKSPVHIRPDLLSEANRFPIGTRENRPVWIAVDIPSDTPAGIYSGTLSRQSASGTVDHRIRLEVQNATLPPPSAWSFHLDLWQHPDAVARSGQVALWSKEHLSLLRPMLTRLAQAGQKCITTTLNEEPWNHQTYDDFGGMIKWTKRADGTWSYDYSHFDTYVALAMECGINKQINGYSMAPVGNTFTWFDEAAAQTVKQVLPTGSPEYNDLWRPFLVAFRAHLRKKGWLGITAIAGDERGWMEMQSLLTLVKETAPELKVALAGDYDSRIDPAIHDFSSYWGSVNTMSTRGGGLAQSRRRQGHVTTFYVACNIPYPNTFTFSPPAEACYLGWFASAMGLDGFLRWAYNSWPENPNLDTRYVKWPSGDTFLVYPEARSSVRFERLREGIQDYEKVRILRTELSGRRTPEAAAAAKRLSDFLDSISIDTLPHKTAADVIKAGKQLVYEIVKSAI